MAAFGKINAPSLKEICVQEILTKILSGELKPGDAGVRVRQVGREGVLFPPADTGIPYPCPGSVAQDANAQVGGLLGT